MGTCLGWERRELDRTSLGRQGDDVLGRDGTLARDGGLEIIDTTPRPRLAYNAARSSECQDKTDARGKLSGVELELLARMGYQDVGRHVPLASSTFAFRGGDQQERVVRAPRGQETK